MLGIYLQLELDRNGSNNFSPIDPPSYSSKQHIHSRQWETGSLALVTASYLDSKNFVFFDNGDFIVLDGHVFHNGKKIVASEIHQAWLIDASFFTKVNGEFFIVIKKGEDFTLISDKLGHRQHYTCIKNGVLSITPCLKTIKRIAGVENKISAKALQTFLFFNKLRYLDHTIWEGVTVFPAGTTVEVNSSGVTKKKYWNLSYEVKHSEPDLDHLVTLYKNAVSIRYNDSLNGAISLSGGLDSRTILAALPSTKNMEAMTIGLKGSDEVEIAKEVAGSKNIPFNHYATDGDIFWKDFDYKQFEEEDIDIILQAVWRPFLIANDKFDYLLHGLDLDVTLGGIYLDESLLSIKSEEEFRNYIFKKCLSTDYETLSSLFNSGKIIGMDSLEGLLDDFIGELEGNNYLEKFDNLIMRFSMGRVILKRYRDIRRYTDTITPMYDSDLMQYIYELPIDTRINYKLFHPFFDRLDPKLFSLTYQRTGLPGNVPVKFWGQSQKIQAQEEELYRKIAFDTDGEFHIPYTKYYTNADEWLRFNEKWIGATNRLLLRKDALITNQYLNRDILVELIRKHQSHEKSYMKILMILMSAEVFLLLSAGENIESIQRIISEDKA